MSIQLDIPDSLLEAMRLPAADGPARLRGELAIALYAQGILSFGKARELAVMDALDFGRLLGERQVPRHSYGEELREDAAYARGE